MTNRLYSGRAQMIRRAAVAALYDVLPAPKAPEPAEVSAQESVAVGEASPTCL